MYDDPDNLYDKKVWLPSFMAAEQHTCQPTGATAGKAHQQQILLRNTPPPNLSGEFVTSIGNQREGIHAEEEVEVGLHRGEMPGHESPIEGAMQPVSISLAHNRTTVQHSVHAT